MHRHELVVSSVFFNNARNQPKDLLYESRKPKITRENKKINYKELHLKSLKYHIFICPRTSVLKTTSDSYRSDEFKAKSQKHYSERSDKVES